MTQLETNSKWQELTPIDGQLSNFDFTVDEGVEDALRTGKHWAQYSAWDFCGYVWFEDGEFKCEVWRYKAPRETIAAPTLKELMHAVSEDYGYD